MGRLILVEGLDLAGKSTLCQGLKAHFEKTGWKVRSANGELCPDNPTARVAREMVRWDPGFTGPEAGGLFMAAHLWDARHFKPPGAGEVHLQDSCWLRSLAFERVIGTPELATMMEAQSRSFPVFDAAIVLTASLETRRARLAQRAQNDLHDLFAFKNPDKFFRIELELAELAWRKAGALVLATDGLDPDQVLAQALVHIERAQRRAG